MCKSLLDENEYGVKNYPPSTPTHLLRVWHVQYVSDGIIAVLYYFLEEKKLFSSLYRFPFAPVSQKYSNYMKKLKCNDTKYIIATNFDQNVVSV